VGSLKKILLTGSKGFVASRFFEYYKDRYNFILLNRDTMDLADENSVYRLFKDETIDIVFHTAAIADTGACQANPQLAYENNVKATVNIAKGCSLKNSVLVFAGSDQVYSANTEDGPYTENTIPLPGNVYAETKFAAENEISALVERYYSLRLTWMFSMPERNVKAASGIVSNVMRALISDTSIYLNENDFRGLTYVYEVIENFEKILDIPYGCYNTGSENNLSVYDIGKVILDVLNASHRVESILLQTSGNRRDLRISNQKLKNYGILFSDSEQAVRRCISEFR